MIWKEIKLSADEKSYIYKEMPLLKGKQFLEALSFHPPGIAAVKDETGAYHIDSNGKPLYDKRYIRTFGIYNERATVVTINGFAHIDSNGKEAHEHHFNWAGNYQEGLCSVRDETFNYYHIDQDGNRAYNTDYRYTGDFKYGIACVMLSNERWTHIDRNGNLLHGKVFCEVGVYHKGIATARDEAGWFHIDKEARPLYTHRFSSIEPFYNGISLATIKGEKVLIQESGEIFQLKAV
jgi:hypothetical protein